MSKSPKSQHAMVELKARVDDLTTVRDKLVQYGAERVGVFHQVDTYFEIPKGRLKLREVEGETHAELIYYEREDVANPKKSSVFMLTIPRHRVFKQILERVMKIKAAVDKVREIYYCTGVQIHLDTVKGLGFFVEFERMTSQDSRRQKEDLQKLEELREKLNINSEALERLSYSDLI